jgi:peptide/nickel transport system substrate-binding protein
MRKSLSIISLLVVLAVVLGACSPTATPTTAPQPTSPPAANTAAPQATTAPQPTRAPEATQAPAPTTAPVEELTLTVAINGQPSRLQPQQPVGRLNEIVNALLYDALTTRDQSGSLIPALAEAWERIDDTTWEFTLREGVTFHNGDPLTAADVKFTYEKLVLDPEVKSPHQTFLQTIASVEVVNDTTFRVITNLPDVLLPSRVFDLYGSIVPQKYYEAVGDAAFDAAPVGTGPYKFVEWVKDSHMTLAANEDYWGGKPAYDTLVLRFITDDAARMAAMLAGEVDVASTVPAARVEELKADAGLDVRTAPSSRFYFVVMNTTQEPFDDPLVRQAVNLAIDREALVLGVGRGYGTPLASVFIPQSFGFDAALQPQYDPERAKSLLAEAGYPDGFDVVFDSFTGSIVDHSKVAEAIVAQLAEVGINATLNVAEYGVFGPKRLAHETNPMYIYSLGDWAFDMGVHLKSYVEGSQGYYFQDPELAAQIDAALGMFDEDERIEAYQAIQQAFYEKAPYGAVYQLEQIWAVSQEVAWDPQPDEMWRFHLATPAD